jgi:hypothetical protein
MPVGGGHAGDQAMPGNCYRDKRLISSKAAVKSVDIRLIDRLKPQPIAASQ